jgi:16S rRNA (cytosine1402-N4)-methyltransferase
MAEHIPVLKDEVIEGLALLQDAVVIDCTLGGGGYARDIIARLRANGTYVGIDADRSAIADAAALGRDAVPRVILKHGNFRRLTEIAAEEGIAKADAIVADLGWRTDQFTGGGKGFSFTADEPLLMTYGDPERYTFTAADIVNEWEESSIADVIYGYGEERYARRIARAIIAAREIKPIRTGRELADIVTRAVPKGRFGRIHPATKTFQALRIAVNDELEALRTLIAASLSLLRPHGRLAIVSFHSLEDRIVKQQFKDAEVQGFARRITKRPITATHDELLRNPRARSAKLRIIERTNHAYTNTTHADLPQ